MRVLFRRTEVLFIAAEAKGLSRGRIYVAVSAVCCAVDGARCVRVSIILVARCEDEGDDEVRVLILFVGVLVLLRLLTVVGYKPRRRTTQHTHQHHTPSIIRLNE